MRVFKIIVVVFFLLLLGGGGAWLYLYSRTPCGWRQVTVVIPRGMGLGAIAGLLQNEGVVTHPLLFQMVAWVSGRSRSLEAGEYEFAPLMTPIEVIRRLGEGEVKIHRLTLVEGWTLKEMADYLEGEGMVKATGFLAICHAPDLIRRITGESGNHTDSPDSLEGYLFPDTYFVNLPVSPAQLVGTFLEKFERIYTQEFARRQGELAMNRHQIMTLASIVEKEARVAEERPLVASVFHNRLRKKMLLGADPTVVYGIPDFDGVIHRSDLANPHPYNTYIHAGLPPGPISNPGLSSIRAALWPADTDYLYFVSKNDGTHHFSATAAEHDRMVREYQR